jgi:hypothetical protein
LHAHYGSSSRTGFHMDEVSQAVSHLPHLGHASELSQADTPESPALGVATSHTRERVKSGHDLDPSLNASAHLARSVGTAHALGLTLAGWPTHPAPQALYGAGLPPPSLAPPLSHTHA